MKNNNKAKYFLNTGTIALCLSFVVLLLLPSRFTTLWHDIVFITYLVLTFIGFAFVIIAYILYRFK